MAVSKIWKVKVRLKAVIDYATNPEKTRAQEYTPEQYQALADVLKYAKDEEKTEREFYVDGINCNPSTARDQFVTVKEQFDKEDGIQAYHGYLSFKDEPNINPDLAQKIGMEFAKRVWGDRFQVVVTTHLNTKHLHCHFVVNSVSFVDGKRMANNEKHWRYFRHIADELCRQYQLDVIENPQRGTGKNYYARKLHEADMPNYVDTARAVIDDAIAKSRSYADFKYVLRQMGAYFDDSENHKYTVLRVKGYRKNIRLARLGDEYTKAVKNITKMYEQLGLAQDDIFHKTKLLLSIYRDVVWATLSDCNCVNEEIYYYGDDLTDALVYLEEFAPDIERSEFERRVCNLFENKWMIDLIDKAMSKVYDYYNNGRLYHEILSKSYLTAFRYTESELLEILNLERSTFYDRKKEAVMLLGIALWGYAIHVFRGIFDVEGDESEIPEFFTGTEKSDLCPTKVR